MCLVASIVHSKVLQLLRVRLEWRPDEHLILPVGYCLTRGRPASFWKLNCAISLFSLQMSADSFAGKAGTRTYEMVHFAVIRQDLKCIDAYNGSKS